MNSEHYFRDPRILFDHWGAPFLARPLGIQGAGKVRGLQRKKTLGGGRAESWGSGLQGPTEATEILGSFLRPR